MLRLRLMIGILAVVLGGSSVAFGGAVILGGDDLGDHGSFSAGANQQGWLYIQKAVDNILNIPGNVTRPGNDGSIAALGSSPSNDTVDNPGAAIGSAASVLGKTITYYDGTAAISQFFDDLAAGNVNPAMIWVAGSQDDSQANDIDAAEGQILEDNAARIASFVNSGGGLMSHGCDDLPCSDVYTWLTAAIPGLIPVEDCNEDGAALTPAGQAAFPGLSNSDIDSNAGPCHNHFEGNFGSLSILALDGEGRAMIIGGGGGTRLAPAAAAPAVGRVAMGVILFVLLLVTQHRLRPRDAHAQVL